MSLRDENDKLRVENLRLARENNELKRNLKECLSELKGTVTLIENWAYGPAFKKAGVHWPDNQCNAPAYLRARRWIKLYYEAHDE